MTAPQQKTSRITEDERKAKGITGANCCQSSDAGGGGEGQDLGQGKV